MKRFITVVLSLALFAAALRPCAVSAKKKEKAAQPSLDISAPSALLMEAETGTILYQKKEHTARPPASVTKVMTLCLIFDAIEKNQISLSDEVTVSEHAASMGGSQVFLEAGEVQTVETLIKCISVASANDACVAYQYSRHSAFLLLLYSHAIWHFIIIPDLKSIFYYFIYFPAMFSFVLPIYMTRLRTNKQLFCTA